MCRGHNEALTPASLKMGWTVSPKQTTLSVNMCQLIFVYKGL